MEGGKAASGVLVLGMHRSGTSAVTRVLSLLGARLPAIDDLMPARPENPAGYWESVSLSTFNDQLLAVLGGSWSGPPPLEHGWENEARLAPLRERASALFRRTFPAGVWLWKDPRNCITLPFWSSVLDQKPRFVLVLRNPLEICRSLETRDGFPKTLALALWERYLRSAVSSLAGERVLVTEYAALLERPDEWCAKAAGFLGMEDRFAGGDPALASAARTCVDPALRHAAFGDDELANDPDVTASQRALQAALRRLEGARDCFEPPELPAETPWLDPLFAVRSAADAVLDRQRGEVELVVRGAEDRKREIGALVERIRSLEQELLALGDRYRAVDVERARLADELSGARAELDDWRGRTEQATARLPPVEAERDAWRGRAAEIQGLLDEILRSRAWRLVEWVRTVRRLGR